MDLNKENQKVQRDKRTSMSLNVTLDELKNKVSLEAHNIDEIIMSANESWEDYKLKYEKSKIIIDPKVIPVGQSILTTATLLNIMEQKTFLATAELNVNTIEEIKNSVSDIQTVVAVGPSCREVKVGDKVKIRMADFFRIKNPNTVNAQEIFELPLEKIDGVEYVEMHERNLKYIYKQE